MFFPLFWSTRTVARGFRETTVSCPNSDFSCRSAGNEDQSGPISPMRTCFRPIRKRQESMSCEILHNISVKIKQNNNCRLDSNRLKQTRKLYSRKLFSNYAVSIKFLIRYVYFFSTCTTKGFYDKSTESWNLRSGRRVVGRGPEQTRWQGRLISRPMPLKYSGLTVTRCDWTGNRWSSLSCKKIVGA